MHVRVPFVKMLLPVIFSGFIGVGPIVKAASAPAMVVDAPALLNRNYHQVVAVLGKPIRSANNPHPSDALLRDFTKYGVWKIKNDYKLGIVFDLKGKAMLISFHYDNDQNFHAPIKKDERRYLAAANIKKDAASYKTEVKRNKEKNNPGMIYTISI